MAPPPKLNPRPKLKPPPSTRTRTVVPAATNSRRSRNEKSLLLISHSLSGTKTTLISPLLVCSVQRERPMDAIRVSTSGISASFALKTSSTSIVLTSLDPSGRVMSISISPVSVSGNPSLLIVLYRYPVALMIEIIDTTAIHL